MLNLVLGIVILAVPELGLVTFALLVGISLVARGAVAIAAGLKLRRLVGVSESRTAPSSSVRAARS